MKKAAGGSACGYCGRRELESAPLALCLRCKLVSYCSSDCQMAHWRRKLGGHKEFCLTPAQRTSAAAQEASPKEAAAAENECIICTADLDADATVTLKCSHRFHAKCIELQKAVSDLKACPTCRGELKEKKFKESPQIKFEQATQLHREMLDLEGQGKLSWAKLSASHQRAMDKIIQAFKREGDKGNALAQSKLGYMHELGQGTPQDNEEALRWYHKSAKQGCAFSQASLGTMHCSGQGVPQDFKEALRWFRKAAKQGDANTQSMIGTMYKNGWGVPASAKEALQWFHKAAKQGDAGAKYKIGAMYENGWGVPSSAKEAQRWFRKAAGQGHTDAITAVKIPGE